MIDDGLIDPWVTLLSWKCYEVFSANGKFYNLSPQTDIHLYMLQSPTFLKLLPLLPLYENICLLMLLRLYPYDGYSEMLSCSGNPDFVLREF